MVHHESVPSGLASGPRTGRAVRGRGVGEEEALIKSSLGRDPLSAGVGRVHNRPFLA